MSNEDKLQEADGQSATSPATPGKRRSGGRIFMIGCGGLIALCLLLAVIYAVFVPADVKERLARQRRQRDSHIARGADPTPSEPDTEHTGARHHQSDTAARVPQSNTATTAEGSLGVPRSFVTDVFGQSTYGFAFRRGVDVKGQENWVGIKNGTYRATIQLIGTEDDLSSAAMLVVLDSDSDANTNPLNNLGRFARLFDSEANEWAASVIRAEGIDDAFDRERTFGRYRLRLQFAPLGQAMMLTLSVHGA